MCTCANVVAPEASQSCPAQLARNEHPPENENGSELCHWKGQLIVGLCVNPVRPCEPPQNRCKAWHSEREHHEAKCKKAAPKQTCLGLAWPCEKQGDQHCEYGHLQTETAHCWLNGPSEYLSLPDAAARCRYLVRLATMARHGPRSTTATDVAGLPNRLKMQPLEGVWRNMNRCVRA